MIQVCKCWTLLRCSSYIPLFSCSARPQLSSQDRPLLGTRKPHANLYLMFFLTPRQKTLSLLNSGAPERLLSSDKINGSRSRVPKQQNKTKKKTALHIVSTFGFWRPLPTSSSSPVSGFLSPSCSGPPDYSPRFSQRRGRNYRWHRGAR